MRNRDPRTRVSIRGRMRTAAGWNDVAIRNVSRRGMLLSATPAPRPGDVIEVRRDQVVMVARAIWCDGALFGVKTQDPIDLPTLLNGSPPAARTNGDGAIERRARPRDPAADADRARARGHVVQSVTLAAAIVVAAGMIAHGVYGILSVPIVQIEQAFAGTPAEGRAAR